MRKIIHILLFWTVFVQISFAQRTGGTHPICTETNTWIAQCSTRPLAQSIYGINPFITGCKHDGNLSLLDRCWVFGQDNQTNALRSIVNPTVTVCTEVNSPTWTQYQGYTGDGATKYLNSNWNPSTATNFTKNNACVFIYNRLNVVGSFTEFGSGNAAAADRVQISARFTGDINAVRINNTTADTYSNSDSRGLFSNVRTSSTAVFQYVNGAQTNSVSRTSTAVSTTACYILAFNNNGSTTSFTTNQVSFSGSGSGAIDQSKLYIREKIMGTKLGWQL